MLAFLRSLLKRIAASANTESLTSLKLDQFPCSIEIYKTTAVVNLKHCYCTKQRNKMLCYLKILKNPYKEKLSVLC